MRHHRFLLVWVNWELHKVESSLRPRRAHAYAIFKSLDTVKFVLRLQTRGPYWMQKSDARVCANAVRFGNLETLTWLREEGFQWDERATELAAGSGHLKMLQWILEQKDGVWTTNGLKLAAAKGHLHVVQWWRNERKEYWFHFASVYAAKYGHLEILKSMASETSFRLRRRGSSLRASELAAAAAGGHLHVVRWIVEENSTFSDGYIRDPKAWASQCAAENGHVRVVEYLTANEHDPSARKRIKRE